MDTPMLTGEPRIADTPQVAAPTRVPVHGIPNTLPDTPEIARGLHCGPWDASETTPVRGRHQLEGMLYLEHADLPIPHTARPHLEFAGDDEDRRAVGVRVDLPAGDGLYRHYMVVSVLAAARSERPWTEWMAENHMDSCHRSGIPSVTPVHGPFGIEVLARADNQESLTIGVDGPSWTVLGTVYGARVTDDARDAAHQLLADMVVHRGAAPHPVGAVLALNPVNPPEHVRTPHHPNYRGETR